MTNDKNNFQNNQPLFRIKSEAIQKGIDEENAQSTADSETTPAFSFKNPFALKSNLAPQEDEPDAPSFGIQSKSENLSSATQNQGFSLKPNAFENKKADETAQSLPTDFSQNLQGTAFSLKKDIPASSSVEFAPKNQSPQEVMPSQGFSLKKTPEQVPQSDDILNTIKSSNQNLNRFEQKIEELLQATQNIREENPDKNPLASELVMIQQTLLRLEQSFQSFSQKQVHANTELPLEEVFNAIRTNNLYLSKLDKKIDQSAQGQLSGLEMSLNDVFTGLRTNNLFLSKVEQKIEWLSKMQEQPSQSNEELKQSLKTHSLYLSKMEQKVNQIAQGQMASAEQKPQLELMEGLRTNNLYLSKMEQKINQLAQANENQAQSPLQQEILTKLSSSQNYLEGIEQKINQIAQSQETNAKNPIQQEILANLKNNQSYLQGIEQKITQLSQQNDTQAQKMAQDEILKAVKNNHLFLSNLEHQLVEVKKQSNNTHFSLQNAPEWNQFVQENKQQLQELKNQLRIMAEKSPDDAPLEKLVEIKQNIEKQENHWQALSEQISRLEKSDSEEALKVHLNSLTEDLASQTQYMTQFEKKLAQMAEKESNHENLAQKIDQSQESLGQLTQKVEELLSPQDMSAQKELFGEIVEGLRSNTTYLANVEQQLQDFTKNRQENSPEEVLAGMRSNNLYLAKVEQKMEQLIKNLERLVRVSARV